jgi:hypothetical protein
MTYILLDLDTVCCFRVVYDIRLGPKNIAKPPVDLMSSMHPVQSASEKALIKVDADFVKVIPVVTLFLV